MSANAEPDHHRRVPSTAARPAPGADAEVDPVPGPAGPGNQALAWLLAPGDAGTPLPAEIRRPAERAFGRDFSPVRLHDGARSRAAVTRIGALAATFRTDVFLGTAAPPIGSLAGWQLLVHELTHVAQQDRSAAARRPAPPVRLSAPTDPAERAAAAVAAGQMSPRGTAQRAAAGTVHRQIPGTLPQPPPGGLPPGLIAQDAAQLAGRVTVGTTSLGEGTFVALQPWTTVVGATTTVAEGAVSVGATTVGTESTVLAGGTATAAGIGGAAAVGVVVVGALLVAGAILFVAAAASAHQELPTEAGKEPGTKDLLPGGAPPQTIIAPSAGGGGSVRAPGATSGGAVRAPAATERGPARLPGAPTTGPVRAPGVVDDPDECRRLITARQDHWHHVFPQEYVNEFDSLGIDIDDFTVKLPWNKHIGRNGIHINLDWNDRWAEFFEQVPNDLTDAQSREWAYKAIDLATELMGDMRDYLREKNLRRLVRYKTNTPSPTVPPKTTGK